MSTRAIAQTVGVNQATAIRDVQVMHRASPEPEHIDPITGEIPMPDELPESTYNRISLIGEPWFVLADLCKVLDLSSPNKVAERIDQDARSSAPVIDSMGRTQQATVVSEAGMYEVVIRSDKPEAVHISMSSRYQMSSIDSRSFSSSAIAPGSSVGPRWSNSR